MRVRPIKIPAKKAKAPLQRGDTDRTIAQNIEQGVANKNDRPDYHEETVESSANRSFAAGEVRLQFNQDEGRVKNAEKMQSAIPPELEQSVLEGTEPDVSTQAQVLELAERTKRLESESYEQKKRQLLDALFNKYIASPSPAVTQGQGYVSGDVKITPSRTSGDVAIPEDAPTPDAVPGMTYGQGTIPIAEVDGQHVVGETPVMSTPPPPPPPPPLPPKPAPASIPTPVPNISTSDPTRLNNPIRGGYLPDQNGADPQFVFTADSTRPIPPELNKNLVPNATARRRNLNSKDFAAILEQDGLTNKTFGVVGDELKARILHPFTRTYRKDIF